MGARGQGRLPRPQPVQVRPTDLLPVRLVSGPHRRELDVCVTQGDRPAVVGAEAATTDDLVRLATGEPHHPSAACGGGGRRGGGRPPAAGRPRAPAVDRAPPSRRAAPPREPGRLTIRRATGDAGEATAEHGGRHALSHAVLSDRRGQVRNLLVQQGPGLLRCLVAWRQTGSSGGDDHVVAVVDAVPQRPADRLAVRHQLGSVGHEPGLDQGCRDHRSRLVRVHPGMRPGRDRDHQGRADWLAVTGV